MPRRWLALAAALVAAAVAAAAAPVQQQQEEPVAAAAAVQQQEEKENAAVTAVIVFGDSIMDPGNNNGLKTAIKANHAPYGKDFAGHEPTGRFSNGLIPSDFIARRLHVKKLLPPYLGVDHTPADLLTGVSFASGATGFDPLTPLIVSVISLQQQLEYFDEYRRKLAAVAGEAEAARVIRGALFVVCAGSDDVANTYFTTPFRSVEYDVPAYVDLLLAGAESFLRNVTARGARRIGFVGLPPIGCLPSQRTLGGAGAGAGAGCEPKRNEASRLYNERARELVGELGKEPGSPVIAYIDIYSVIEDLVAGGGGGRYGFAETRRGCCGTGTIEVTALCDARFVAVCGDVSEHIFFDSYHPTERAYDIIVDYIFANDLKKLHL